MPMYNLSGRVAQRFRHDQLRQRIIVARWLLAKRLLSRGLKAVLQELKAGDLGPVIKALDDFWMVFEIHESPGEIGSVYTIDAEWFYPLGPRVKARVKTLIMDAKNLRRDLESWSRAGEPPSARGLQRFEDLVKEAAWLESVIPRTEEGFPHGDFTIIPMKGVSSRDIDDCLAALDKAAMHIRLKFSQILYGKVFLGKSVGKGFGNVAIYVADHDTISLSVRTKETVGDVHAICHELGHRFFHKFWKNKDQRNRFWELSVNPVYEKIDFDKATRAKLADEFISNSEKIREGQKPPNSDLLGIWINELKRRPGIQDLVSLGRKFTFEKDDSAKEPLWDLLALPGEPTISVMTDRILREPLVVSDYAKRTNWMENFAEAFAFYVMGKPLPAEITDLFKTI